MSNPIEDVAAFMRRFNQPFPADNPERDKWLKEEMHELVDATFDLDKLAVLDAVIDWSYVALGAALENPEHRTSILLGKWLNNVKGVFTTQQLEDAWQIVHNCNMSKVWTTAQRDACTDASIVFTPCGDVEPGSADRWVGQRNGKVVKPPGWVGPEAALKELLLK